MKSSQITCCTQTIGPLFWILVNRSLVVDLFLFFFFLVFSLKKKSRRIKEPLFLSPPTECLCYAHFTLLANHWNCLTTVFCLSISFLCRRSADIRGDCSLRHCPLQHTVRKVDSYLVNMNQTLLPFSTSIKGM